MINDSNTCTECANDESCYGTIEPRIAGNEKMEILDHHLIFSDPSNESGGEGVGIDLRNISESTIGKAELEVTFYGENSDILETRTVCLTDMEADKIYSINIKYSNKENGELKGYSIKVVNIIQTPVPTAIGNDKIKIINHSLQIIDSATMQKDYRFFIEMAIRNIFDKTIATALFEVVLYDSEGGIVDKFYHKEYELKPGRSRAINIDIYDDKEIIKSYRVTLLKAVTSDAERIQLRRNEIRSVEGGEEVRGIIKNISDVKTDAAIVATFEDAWAEKIGVKIIMINDINPGEFKQFHFVFTPPEGAIVKEYFLSIGEVTEQLPFVKMNTDQMCHC
ncbi:MAG: hypothetical protein ACOWWO_16700 [Peptococcaceae bacterium]